MWFSQCFKIQILKTDGDPFDVSKAKPILRIDGCESLSSYFEMYPMHHEADPFLFVHNDKLFLFYESKRFYKDGLIMMTCTKDLKTWTEPVKVLDEPFHLSYPWVFVDNGVIYMIPESEADRSIRLYKADNEELTSFSFVKRLIADKDKEGIIWSFSDSSFIVKDGKYFMLTSQYKGTWNPWNGTYHLRLFVADSLDGEYVEHPCSPICISNKFGRNGGCILTYDGKNYRVAQDCGQGYGGDINLMEIKELSIIAYKETIAKQNLLRRKTPFYKGGHQYNIVKFKDATIIATDTPLTKMFLWAKLCRQIKILICKTRESLR